MSGLDLGILKKYDEVVYARIASNLDDELKSKKDEFLNMDFLSVIEWSAQEYQELKELDLSIKAHSINLKGYQQFSSLVILQQRQRRSFSELLRNTNKGGLADTEEKRNKLKKALARITSEIQETIGLVEAG